MSHPFQEIKRVCIYGTGGVGGYYGGRIAEAFQKDELNKREIYFIARGGHLKALQRNGITVKTPDRRICSRPTKATHDIREIPAPDLIFLCTKSYDLKTAVEGIKANAKETTIIIPLLNGVDVYERIRTDLKIGIVLPSCVYLGTHVESPGVINQSGGDGIILSGPDPQFPLYDGLDLQQFFRESNIGFRWSDSSYPAIWEKFIFIAAFGLVTAYSGKSLGEVMESDELKNLVHNIIQEIVSIAEKKSIKLLEFIVEMSMKKASNFPFNARTSYQRDVENWPKQNEGDLYGATIIREGRAYGVQTPFTEMIYSHILHIEG